MNRCLRPLLGLLAVLAVLVPATGALAAPAATVSRTDAAFMRGNAHTDLAEITIGGIALDRSTDSAVRELATVTISDHTTALSQLSAVASDTGVHLPDQPNTSQRKAAARLATVPAGAFDLTYLQVQVAGHEKSIAATRHEIAAGTDPEVIAFAKGYLPVAEMHLKMARHALRGLR